MLNTHKKYPPRRSPVTHRRATFLLTTLFTILAITLTACSAPRMPFGSSQPPPTPTAALPATEPVSPTLDATIAFEAGSLTLNYPQGWHTRMLSQTLMLAAREEALNAATPGDDLFVTIDATPLSELVALTYPEQVTSTQKLFDISIAGPQQAGYTLSETIPITVNDTSGLAADMQGSGGAGRLVVLQRPAQVVRIMGQANPSGWAAHRSVFDAMVQSLHFSPTAAAELTLPTPTPLVRTQQPVRTLQGPAGFVLRLGGNVGPLDGRFISARGIAVGSDGKVYLAESSHGIWVFEPDGTLATTFGTTDILDAYDIDQAPNGDLVVADYGRNDIARFSPDGTLLHRWGEAGNEPHQFGLLSPQRIAVGADGTVYALDSHTNTESTAATSSIVRFNGEDGSFIERIELPPESAPGDIAVDALGNIYLAETFSGIVLKLDSQGQVLSRIGEHLVPGGIKASVLDIDSEGNIFTATWNEAVLKFAPDGTLLAQGGAMTERGTIPQPAEFILPNGIAIAPDGIAWVSDNDGEYSAITALRLVNDTEAQATAQAQAATLPQVVPTPEPAYVRQWASSATASSQYNEQYSANNVIGPPDVPGCQDSTNAWASAQPDGLDTLEVGFDTPIRATQIIIHQNHQPGFITSVALLDEQDEWTEVYSGTAQLQNTCPYAMEVNFEVTPTTILRARLTVDQRSGANWSEIDAVELVGVP